MMLASNFSDMPLPALCPVHASSLAFPPTGRLPSTLSAANALALFEASSVLCSRPTPRLQAVRHAVPYAGTVADTTISGSISSGGKAVSGRLHQSISRLPDAFGMLVGGAMRSWRE
jgi:hypothetical protein